METIQHIHHISAIVGNVQKNLTFYREILGLRLVKQTVNFDDAIGYHLYFANQEVSPGTLMTFFPWEGAKLGQKGSGQGGRIAFRIPKGQLDFWKRRLKQHAISVEETEWLSHKALYFQDQHSLDLALVEGDVSLYTPQILGFHGVELRSNDPSASREFLKAYMGLIEKEETESAYCLETVGKEKQVILIPKMRMQGGSFGPGTVHHIAWNVSDQDSLMEYSDYLKKEGYSPTVVRNRKYFKSIYLREAGQVIYEFATAGPGLTVDEPFEQLGQSLQLPKQYENRREEIMATLEPLEKGN